MEWFLPRNDVFKPYRSQITGVEAALQEIPDDEVPDSIFHHDESAEAKASLGPEAGSAEPVVAEGGVPGMTFVATVDVAEPLGSESNLLAEAARAEGARAQGASGYHIRGSNEFAKEWELDILIQLFPHLFPYGRGGWDEVRRRPVRPERCVAHYLRLSTHAFHETEFNLVVYDLLERAKSVHHAFVSCLQPSVSGGGVSRAIAFASLTVPQLSMLAKYKEDVRAALLRKRPPPPLPDSLKKSGVDEEFLKTMHYACGVMRHTEEFAKEARKDMWSMHANEGKASLFVTVNPDDTGSLIIHLLRGGKIDDEVPPLHIRQRYLANFPGATALSFERVMDVITKVILGWDERTGRSTKQGGLFGHVKGWMRAVEEQKRLSLHVHILVWLFGHNQLRKRLLAPGGVEKLQKYSDDALSAAFPVGREVSDAIGRCFECQAAGVEAVWAEHDVDYPAAKKYRHKLGDDPSILECTEKKHRQSPDALADGILSGMWSQTGMGGEVPTTAEAVTALKWRGRPAGLHPQVYGPVLIRYCNWHKTQHMKTCENSRWAQCTGNCRSRMPGCLCSATLLEVTPPGCTHVRAMIEEAGGQLDWSLEDVCEECGAKPLVTFQLRRTPESAWMPQTSPYMVCAFGCNCNCQYVYNQLMGCYQGMYATKSTKENSESYKHAMQAFIHCRARQEAVELEIVKCIEEGKPPPPLPYKSVFGKGVSNLIATTRGHTKAEVLGAPRASYFNLGYTGWQFCRKTAAVPFTSAIAFLQGKPVWSRTGQNGPQVPRVYDYVYRPLSLEGMEWLRFVKEYDRAVVPKKKNQGASEVLPFLSDHPLPTHGVQKRSVWRYPRVKALRLPDRTKLEHPGASEKDRILYGQLALVLTVPWREMTSFQELAGTGAPLG
jgi:hypothetical protein